VSDREALQRLVGQQRQAASGAVWTATGVDRMGYLNAVTSTGYPSEFSRTEWLALRLVPLTPPPTPKATDAH
jgi:hypothetical protein